MSAENGEFPTGPSFLDYDRPDVRMVELPAWLQTFAATVGEPDEAWPQQQSGDQPENGDEPSLAVEDDDSELAPWLQDAGGESQNGIAAGNGSAVDPAFMISEEDLPEWLRSISPEEAGETASGDAAVGGGAIPIPTVSRAWVPDVDQPSGVDESASVFSLVASQGHQAAYTGAGDQDVEGDQFHALEQTRPVLANASGQGMAAQDSSADKAEGEGSSQEASRLLPLLAGVALLVLILLIVVFLL